MKPTDACAIAWRTARCSKAERLAPQGPAALLLTVEHGGNRVPAAYAALFAPHREVLATHRGFDAGALVVARELAAHFAAPLVAARTTRLLVDLNRSVGRPGLFSAITRPLPRAERERILDRHYRPYREEVERAVAAAIARHGRVLHLSCHSFTPVLDGQPRNADIGLLYDPGRRAEREFAARWRAALRGLRPGLRVRFNYPYAGRADGLTTHLRRLHPGRTYAGIELEVNQRHPLGTASEWRQLRHALRDSLEIALR